MTLRGFVPVLLGILVMIISACASRQETAVRHLVNGVIDAAKKGDRAAVVAALHPESPLRAVLQGSFAAGGMDAVRARLDGVTVEIVSVAIDGPRAEILIRYHKGAVAQEQTLIARQTNDGWRLENLPSLPVR